MASVLNALPLLTGVPLFGRIEPEPRVEQAQQFLEQRITHLELTKKYVQRAFGRAAAPVPSQQMAIPRTVEAVAKETGAKRVAVPGQSREMSWLVANPEVVSQYVGEWLLIRGEQLLAHSRDFRAIRDAIREHQIASPFVYYVPTDRESNFVSI